MSQLNNFPQQDYQPIKTPKELIYKTFLVSAIAIVSFGLIAGIFFVDFGKIRIGLSQGLSSDSSSVSVSAVSLQEKEKKDQTLISPEFKFAQTKPESTDILGNGGVNWRQSPCGEVAGNLRRWGHVGEVLEGPVESKCNNKTYKWWRLRWQDNQEGWVAEDFINLSNEKPENKVGFLKVNFLSRPSDDTNEVELCAFNNATKVDFCNNKPVPVDEEGRKKPAIMELPYGEYLIYAKAGPIFGTPDTANFPISRTATVSPLQEEKEIESANGRSDINRGYIEIWGQTRGF
jgi:hypothetical protein